MPFRLLLAIVLGFAALACGDDDCDIEGYTRDLGGIGVKDCNASPDADLITACVVAQAGQGTPFRAVYDREGGGYQALVGTGETYLTQRPKGDGIEEAECTALEPLTINGEQQMACADPGEYSTVCE